VAIPSQMPGEEHSNYPKCLLMNANLGQSFSCSFQSQLCDLEGQSVSENSLDYISGMDTHDMIQKGRPWLDGVSCPLYCTIVFLLFSINF
jgi:hypothetical protein